MEENRGSEQGLTELYLNQEHSRGPGEASAIEQAHIATRASSPDESEDTDDYDLAASHMHAGMTDGTLETHQMLQRSYGLYD
ncbi:hypothetical protein [Paenibacillus alvei]|uniref:Uncharacterized protein n=1 Tax=Paenibacillus alvei TaxID=44250 RepID=A0AAP6ZVP8_PAEAL|nr:hypothetical protein [Paenibacillus alvei]MBG9734967.1 hypothetical protein [Paenibacillus alvei]MBG9744842.1 hypothetical protein [Paenibacillus alvei]MCY9578707.1 hypothetical protein [Paenibacillus alvei]MCY9583766.1 hypothetical protein [Paenibacillus alvei]NEZ42650.1 hypothetical protein [Paenibacillus alvei]